MLHNGPRGLRAFIRGSLYGTEILEMLVAVQHGSRCPARGIVRERLGRLNQAIVGSGCWGLSDLGVRGQSYKCFRTVL